MDTATATPTAERAAKLRNQLAALDVAKQKTESKLAEEHATLRRVASKRGELVESLTGANEVVSRRAHKELDECDSAIRVTERMTEGLQKALSKTVQEIESLRNELGQIEQAIAAEAQAEGLRVFAVQLKQARRSAEEALSNARTALAALNSTAARGVEQYGVAAQNFVLPALDEFRHGQVNPELLGWRDSRPNFANLQFTVRPMVKG